ncbi:DUF1993 domain-containing protein [Paucibacter sp. APW11]|uniref:DUF1993 domain-containing protein n=1 Tax=Roseateles aquae TaxID=3077235 RepID=A0ABU3P8E1_9BURK|nr:DUF1993 domain-containing protein [Paucibacter sp. APW11]MDT8998838.1 DUF1993 domain-containing protein [Paucibacter sp. APW11]
MSLTMYTASIPVFTRMLGNALTWLERAAAHAEAKKFDPAVYMTLRLAPDMFPLPRQIQIACDMAKGAAARLGGIEVPSWEDKEASLAELAERIQRTITFVNSVPQASIEGSEARAIVLPRRVGEPLHFSGEDYLRDFVLPHFYFHLTTTYGLLRQAGVELGKADFIGR